jgi:hypothetical protein
VPSAAPATHAPAHAAAPEPAKAKPKPASPAAPKPTQATVQIVVTGNVAPSQYGTNSDQHNVSLPSLAGSASYSLPYDSQAQYYYGDAIMTGLGTVTVKIVAGGQMVAHGSATSDSGVTSGGDAHA